MGGGICRAWDGIPVRRSRVQPQRQPSGPRVRARYEHNQISLTSIRRVASLCADYCVGCSGGELGGFQNDAFVRHIADYLNSSGLQVGYASLGNLIGANARNPSDLPGLSQALGYRYVNMDASWNLPTRDANGNLQPNPSLWPNGLQAVVDYVHSKGLGFGLSGDRGTMDCAKNPGNLGHETQVSSQ